MAKDTFVWITARDGSVHATRPPMVAAGHLMLCGLSYGRRDLRIESQGLGGYAPAGACAVCRSRIATPAAGDAAHVVPVRKAPTWP